MRFFKRTFPLFFALFFFAETFAAYAHHPWGGAPPTLWYQGLLSGFAHPALGFDHLAFLAAIAVLCAVCFGGGKILAVFIPATVAGVFARLLLAGSSVEIPFYETAVCLTVSAAGVFVFRGGLSYGAAIFFTGLFGAFHGYAYGGGIVGAETSPLVFYLLGLAVVQTAVVFAIAFFVSKFVRAFSGNSPLRARGFSKVAGALLFVAGAVMSVQSGIAPF